MAEYKGIAKISGLDVSSGSYKVNGRLNSDIWDISSAPRQSNLYKTLTNSSWGSYTQGRNYASFVAVGDSSSTAYVLFAITDHTAGDTYDFEFNKTLTQGARIFELRVSEASNLTSISGGGQVDVGALSGSQSTSITASSSNSTMYIGFIKTSTTSTDTLDIGNFRVSRS